MHEKNKLYTGIYWCYVGTVTGFERAKTFVAFI